MLSGGGARGAAHVGVLKVLEELRIPFDCIVGTSMGSIVGGLSASGLSPDLMDDALRSIDWSDTFDDAPSRRRMHFRRKQDDLLPLFPFELGIGRGRLRASAGLVSDRKLRFILRQLSLHTLTVDHFDDLRLPFRAVAADLADGSLVVLEDGSLVEAMRASMAVPGAFTPVTFGDRVLVDGGITANLPVEVALQELGAERVIAVDISGRPRELQGDETAFGVLYQAFSVVHQRNVDASKRLLDDDDLLLEPDLGDVRSTEFDRVGDAIDRGEAAARARVADLAELAVSEAEYRNYLRRHRIGDPETATDLMIATVEVEGSERVDDRQITRRIETRAGEQLDLPTLRLDLDRIYQIGEFESVDFEIARRPDGDALIIDTTDKPWGPSYLRVGLTFSADFAGESDFLAVVNYRQTQLSPRGAEWQTLLFAGDTNSIYSEWFQPLDFGGSWFVRPWGQVFQDQFVDATRTFGTVEVLATTLGVDIGLHLENYAELSLGIEAERLDISTDQGTDFDGDRVGLRAMATVDQIDDVYFPRAGLLASLDFFWSVEELGADESYDRLALELLGARSFGPHTFLGRLRIGSSLGSELPIYDDFELGGFSNLSAFGSSELRGDALGFASLGYYRRIGKLYVGGALELGNAWVDADAASIDDLEESILLFVGRNTLAGPLYVGYGVGDSGRDSLYLFLGRLF
ncbi:MAG: patatin-like phospholipase family protein [Acidobacteriota bacterium]